MFRRSRMILLVAAAMALVATACSSSKSTSTGGGATTTIAAKQGGDVVFSAEQEPDCMDWIGSCAGAAWGDYTVEATVQPRASAFTAKPINIPAQDLTLS